MSAEAEAFDSLDCLWLQYCEPLATNYKWHKVTRPCCCVFMSKTGSISIQWCASSWGSRSIKPHKTLVLVTTENDKRVLDMKHLCDFGEALQSGHCVPVSLKPEKQRDWRSVVWSLNTLQVKLSPCPPPWSSRLRKPSLHTGRISPNRQTSEQIWMGWGWSWVCESGSLGGKGQINIRQIISEEKLIYCSHVQLSFQSDWHWPVNSKSPKINISDYLWC